MANTLVDDDDPTKRRRPEPLASQQLAEIMRREHSMGFVEAARLYPSAVAWSMFMSVGVIMLAFDPQLLGNFFAMPQFRKDFGYLYDGQYIISASWQSSLALGNPIGQVVGALAAGYPMDRFGRKRTFAVCVLLTGSLVCIQLWARSLPVLLVGELLGGLVLGSYVVIAPAYTSEVCPVALRGHLTAYINLCFVIGQLLANIVTTATSHLHSHWAYSIPFALQWFWVLLLLPSMFFVPESPWWLVRNGRHVEAEAALRRLASPRHVGSGNRDIVAATLAVIAETDRLEQQFASGSSYADCFRGANLRRTQIAIGVYSAQVLSGIYLISYGTYFFTLAGLPTERAFEMGIGFLGVGFVATVLSWFLLRWGRRTIFLAGLLALAVLMFAIAILDCIPGRLPAVAWAESSLMLVWNFAYDLTVGPVCFVIIAECSATRVRSKSIAIATASQGFLGILMTIAIPYLMNPDQLNLQGKLGFIFGSLALLCFVWTYFCVPETAGRTYEELDLLFSRRVPAWKFRDYKIQDVQATEDAEREWLLSNDHRDF